MLACDWEEVRPDVVILGKALGGGVIPVSVVLADRDVMLCIRAGEHGRFVVIPSDLRLMVSLPSLDNLSSKKLGGFSFMICVTVSLQLCLQCLKSAHLGQELLHQLLKVQEQFLNYIKDVRGRGLFTAVELNSRTLFPVSAYDICLKMKERGVLAKTTHDTIVRLTPPLCMSLDELQEGSKAVRDVLELDLANMLKAKPKDSPTAAIICDRCGRNLYDSSDKDL